MKKIVIIFISLLFVNASFSQVTMADTLSRVENNYFVIQKAASEYFDGKFASNSGEPTYKTRYYDTDSGAQLYNKIDGEWAKYQRWNWYWRDRIMPDGSFPDVDSIYKIHHYKTIPKKRGVEPVWSCINQTTCTGGYNGMGRTKAVAFHPTDPNIFYVGAPIGGLWKTSDGGLSYKQLTDSLPYVAAGTVVVDYANPNNVYISVSDNGGWWNYSLGIYKSTDGGTTWKPTDLVWNFSDKVAVYSMAISPSNASTIIVAASNGLWRTTNGGTTWTRVRTGAHNDIKYRPGDGQTVYATTDDYWGSSEVYRSTNGGVNWSKMSSFAVGKNGLRLAVSPANADMLAVLHTSTKELYVSKDKGANYTFKSTVEETAIIGISPTNENVLYSGYMCVYKSSNGGTSWTKITEWYGGTALPAVHADQQFVAFNPLNNLLYFCNDGGLYQYNETTNKWKEFSNGLIITQYYRIAVAQNNNTMLIGGTQDNGGRMRNANGSWTSTNGGDAMEVAVDPNDYNISYSTYCYGELFRTTNNWKTNTTISNNIPGKPKGDWVTPYLLDPQNSKVIVAGYNEVFRSTDRGTTWTQISSFGAGNIQCVTIAPSNSNIIYASRENTFYKTNNLGANWTTYTGPNSTDRITSIAVDPSNDQHVVITYAGYTSGKKVYTSNNGGATFTSISGSLPNVPINTVIFENGSNGQMYVGSDAGVYRRDNSESNWTQHGVGLPNTSVTDLEIQYSGKKLRAATHGRGVWEVDLYGVVYNELPQVSITQPASGTILDNSSLTITAQASDGDGSISSVEFFINGVSAGVVNSAPYSITLSAMMAGDVVILAAAYDDKLARVESTPISISVPCANGFIAQGTIIGTSGSYNNLGNTIAKVFDGNTTTYFDSPIGNGSWAGLDLEEKKVISGFRFYPRASYVERMKDGKLQVANNADFSDAKTVYTIPLLNELSWFCVYNYDTEAYRYVRFLSPDGGYGNISELEVYTLTTTQKISLDKGWNLISTNLISADNSIATLFNGLNVQSIKNMTEFWYKDQPEFLNSLQTFEAGEGYLVNMNATGTLTIIGTPIVETLHATSLQSGWNIIGCPYRISTPFSTDFNTSNCTIIKNFNGFWEPYGTQNSIENFELGKGYFLKK